MRISKCPSRDCYSGFLEALIRVEKGTFGNGPLSGDLFQFLSGIRVHSSRTTSDWCRQIRGCPPLVLGLPRRHRRRCSDEDPQRRSPSTHGVARQCLPLGSAARSNSILRRRPHPHLPTCLWLWRFRGYTTRSAGSIFRHRARCWSTERQETGGYDDASRASKTRAGKEVWVRELGAPRTTSLFASPRSHA